MVIESVFENSKGKKDVSFFKGVIVGIILIVFVLFLWGPVSGVFKNKYDAKSDPIAFLKAEDAKAAGGALSEPGKEAADFTLTDINGNVVKLSDFRGKNPVIIEIFSTWCGICISETDDFRKLLNNFPKARIISIDIDPTESNEDIKRFVRAYSEGYENWIYARDTDQVAIKYGAPFTGTTILIDENGKIVYRDSYSTEYEVLVREFEKLGYISLDIDDSILKDIDTQIQEIKIEDEIKILEERFGNQRYNLAVLEIKGLVCPACIKIVNDALKETEGVVEVVISLFEGKGAVIYDPSIVDVNDIVNNSIFSDKNEGFEWTYDSELVEDRKI